MTQYQYDLAGNRMQQTDARNIIANYSYDALNRLTAISYPSDPNLDVTYAYDQGTHGLGRLTGMTDSSGSTSWTYDRQGRITAKTQTVGSAVLTVQYQYDTQGHLDSITYPDGSTLNYRFDDAGRLAGASVTPSDGSAQTLLQNVSYLPFGPINQLDYAGNYPDQQRHYDLDYRPTALTGPLARTYATDPVGNITAITTTTAQGTTTWHYAYDSLYRLLGVEQPVSTPLQSLP